MAAAIAAKPSLCSARERQRRVMAIHPPFLFGSDHSTVKCTQRGHAMSTFARPRLPPKASPHIKTHCVSARPPCDKVKNYVNHHRRLRPLPPARGGIARQSHV